MRKINYLFKMMSVGLLGILTAANTLAQAPEGFMAHAFGPEDLVLGWTADVSVDSYQMEQSSDSVNFTILGETTKSTFEVDGLSEKTTYYYRLTAIIGGSPVGEVGLKTETSSRREIVDMPLDELVDGDKIKNVLTDSTDVVSNGQLTLVDAATSGLGMPAINFLGDGPVPIASYVRLYNTVLGMDSAFTEKTVSFWMKNESPDKNAVPISFGKRAGMTIAIKDGMLHAFTIMRTGDSRKPWSDSTGVAFSSAEWTHISYVFDSPVTKLYVNGVLADESDGLGLMDGVRDSILPWPTYWEAASGGDKSAEIGCLVDPNEAMVQYLGDTYDAGIHASYSFNGMMAGVKMYNYALTDEEISDMIAPAPTGLTAPSSGHDEVALSWTMAEADTYQVSKSTDGLSWEVVDTTMNPFISIDGLSASTSYTFKVASMSMGAVGGSSTIEVATSSKRMIADMPLDELVDGDKIKNVLTDSTDVVSNGQLTLVDAATSGLGIPAINFLGDGPVPIASYVRLYNTVLGMDSAFTEKTVSFWMKNESPDKNAVPISFGKRAGMAIAIKDGMLHAFTIMRTGDSRKPWSDSTGVAFSSAEWTHISYVFDSPVTKLYVNGVLADESDGLGLMDGVRDSILPWPTYWEAASGGDKSAEIGCLVDPNEAMVQYLGDTYDAGIHASYSFNGMMAGVKMYNYALADADIKAQFDEYAITINKLGVWAVGEDNATLAWENVDGNTGYKIEMSEDGNTWTEAATLDADVTVYTATGLTAGTEYSFRLTPLGVEGVIGGNVVSGSTITPEMQVRFDFAELVDGTGVKNIVTDAVDNGIEGTVSTSDIPDTEIVTLDKGYKFLANTGSIVFTSSETPPISSYVRLSETVMPAGIGLNQRTVSVWLKNDEPSKYSVPLSMGKRTGITLAYKDGMFHAFTKMRPFMTGPWWADSTGVELSTTDWTHITYVFDNPVTKLYINGVLADESDGIFFNSGDEVMEALPFASGININEPSSTNGQSAEIGSLFEPCAALVQYLEGNWDLGARNPFFGSMSDLRYYNYALTDDEIVAVMMENLEEVVGLDRKQIASFEVYPNPTSEVLNFKNADNADVVLFDKAGRMVINTKLTNKNQIDVSSLSSGIYFVKISMENSTEIHKVSIIK